MWTVLKNNHTVMLYKFYRKRSFSIHKGSVLTLIKANYAGDMHDHQRSGSIDLPDRIRQASIHLWSKN